MISRVSSSPSSNTHAVVDIEAGKSPFANIPQVENGNKKLPPQGYDSYASLKDIRTALKTKAGPTSSKNNKTESLKGEPDNTSKVEDDKQAPQGRTVGDVTGRIIGYDENFNPITEEQLEASAKSGELYDQKIDNLEASAGLNAIMTAITGKQRLNEEFLAYLDKRYSNASRPPDGMDVYVNPQNYTPEQKMARYLDLVKLKGQFEAYRDARLKPNTGHMMTIKTEPEIKRDIEQAMDTLLEDPAMAGLLSSDYLFFAKEIMAGKQFQDDPKKYGQDFKDAVDSLRTDLESRFESSIVNGGIFKDGLDRGVNVKTILANYNTTLNAFGSIFSAEYIESRKNAIETQYKEFYNTHVDPLLPDVANGYDGLLRSSLSNFYVSDDQKDMIGLVTPTIDGKAYVDLGLELKTSDLTKTFRDLKVDEKTLEEMRSLGLDPSLLTDGFAAAFLPTVKAMAEQIFGKSPEGKADRAAFMSTVINELKPLIAKLDQGMDTAGLNDALEQIRTKLGSSGGPMATHGNEVTTALNGLVRGANLTGNKLLRGMYGAGTGYSLEAVQALTALAVGYEGKGLALQKHPEGATSPDDVTDNSGTARTVFGTESRMWDSSLLQRFGTDGLQYYSGKFTGDVRDMLPSSLVKPPIFDTTSEGRKAIDDALKIYAEAVAKGIYGDDAESVKTFSSNLVRFTYLLWAGAKPGGGMNRLYENALDLASVSKGNFSTGDVTVSDQHKFMAKWGTAFLGGIRAIEAGVSNSGKLDPTTIAAVALFSAGGASQILDIVGFQIKSSIDSRILYQIGEYGDALKQITKTSAIKVGGALGGLVDIAWLPLDIVSFVKGLKSGQFDTPEKIFQGVMIATDVGIAIDGALALTKAIIPSVVLQTSRLAFLFSGTGAAIMSVVGSAFALVNIAVLFFLNFWQDAKMAKQFDKAGQELDNNLGRFVDDNVSSHLGFYPEAGDPWGGKAGAQKLWQMHLDNMYKDEVTKFDWDATRAANRVRNGQAAA